MKWKRIGDGVYRLDDVGYNHDAIIVRQNPPGNSHFALWEMWANGGYLSHAPTLREAKAQLEHIVRVGAA